MEGTEILRIIEGGLANDKRKVVSYATRLADRLAQEGKVSFARSIRKKLEGNSNGIISDALRTAPIDSDSRLQIVEIIPPESNIHNLVLDPLVEGQVHEFIDIVNHSSLLENEGIDIPKTLLLYGPPGCGKTTLAHYISAQTNLPLVIAKLDGLVSSLLGSTSKNIRKIFEYVKDFPCILFLDEFDAIAKARDDMHEIGELKRVINSLLQNIDFMPTHCILLAATNHPELLDRAVWRRFIQKIEVAHPSVDLLPDLLKILCAPYSIDMGDASLKENIIVNCIDGISPADLKSLFERAKIKSVIENKRKIEIDQLLLGLFELQNGVKSEKEYVTFLSERGVSQRNINIITGISLRKIKNYLKREEE